MFACLKSCKLKLNACATLLQRDQRQSNESVQLFSDFYQNVNTNLCSQFELGIINN